MSFQLHGIMSLLNIKLEHRHFFRLYSRYRATVNFHLDYSSNDYNDDSSRLLLEVESGWVELCWYNWRNSFCTFERALYIFQTWRAAERDPDGIEKSELHTNRDWHMNLSGRRTPKGFLTRAHRSADIRLLLSGRKMQSVPSKQNSWKPVDKNKVNSL